MKFAIICNDSTSYIVEAETEEAAIEMVEDRENGTEVEDELGVEMPEKMQWDGSGADWLEKKARAAGMNVVRL